jgi:glyoxylase I family protein
MALRGLHHVQVNVPSVEAVASFYEMLGMTRRIDRPDIGVDGLWLDAGSQQIHLIEAAAPPDLGQHFAVEVDDLDAVVASLRAQGVTIGEPAALGEGLSRQTSLRDPAGNRIELREPPR